MQKSIILGVTGGIGSGKTLVCEILSTLNIPIYQADDQAKYLMSNDLDLVSKIKKAFGEESYLPNKQINRVYLAKEVFSKPSNLSLINSFVHPAVKASFQKWCLEKQDHPILVKEAALLFESGSYVELDKVVVVNSPLELKMKRILARDTHRSEKDVLAIMKNQWTEEMKMEKADYVVWNNDKELLIPQVLGVIQDIKKPSLS